MCVVSLRPTYIRDTYITDTYVYIAHSEHILCVGRRRIVYEHKKINEQQQQQQKYSRINELASEVTAEIAQK